MHPEINPEITRDDTAPSHPMPSKVQVGSGHSVPESAPTVDLGGGTAQKEGGCGDPECPFCRWVPIIDEITENISETDVMENLVENGYPLGFSLGLLPKRIAEAESTSMMELVDGLEEGVKTGKHVIIPDTRVADILDSIKCHLDEADDLLTLTVINDRMLTTAVGFLGVMLDPKSPSALRRDAARWFKNMTHKDPKTS